MLQAQRDNTSVEPITTSQWRLLDPKFKRNAPQYVSQCMLATVTVFVVLLVLDAVTQTALLASLGASAFIAFTMPHINAARPRYLLGGYVIGTVTGCSMALLAQALVVTVPFAPILGAAIGTGGAIFLMVITDTEHPPAAALALGYVLNDWTITTVIVVLTGILAISLIKESGQDNMINLL